MKLDSKNPLIFFVINQLKYAKNIDEIIIATTKESQNNKIEKFCIENKIDFFRGSTNDVLDRYYQCSKQFSISNIVRITCDNPLLDPKIVDKCIKKILLRRFFKTTKKLLLCFKEKKF